MSTFPVTRLRRFRRTAALRSLVRETRLSLDDFVYPLFVCPGEGVERPLEGLPGIAQRSVDKLCEEAADAHRLGVSAVLLFGIPEEKDEAASGAYDDDGIVQRALRALREQVPGLVLLTDVCLCEYTSHGHCGLVEGDEVLNDVSLELLAKTAVSHAEAGADAVCPSDMLDGRVGAIRGALDGEGFEQLPIVAYSAKYASAFYGPFREAAESTPAFGDRRSYQMDPPNVREALRECELDLAEGADAIMVKPALPYLDVIRAARERFDAPALRLQRQRRVRDGQGGRGARLARRAPGRGRGPDRDQARGGRRDRLVLGEGAGGVALTGDAGSSAARARSSPAGSTRRSAPGARSGPRSRSSPRAARAPYLWDADGNRYIDWVMSWGPLVFGHADPEVVEAVQEAAADGTTFGAPTEREVELAEEIVDAVPSVEKVRLVSSGTEAAMSALRLARGVTRRDRILKFTGCYHGHADGLLAEAGSGLATLGIPATPGVPAGAAGDTVVTTYNDVDAAAAAVERYGEGLAAIIVEPVAGNMGVVPPEPGFLEALRALCDASGALLVFDEVITGFRVARGGAQELYGVTPDLTVLGKIVGGGLPLAAFGGRADVMEELAPAGPVYQAGTLSGNPLATAAALVVLRRLRDPAVYERLEEAGARLEAGLVEASAGEQVVRAARRRHGHALLPGGTGPELRGCLGERHGALRRVVPAPAGQRHLRGAVAVRGPVRLHRARRGRDRRNRGGCA